MAMYLNNTPKISQCADSSSYDKPLSSVKVLVIAGKIKRQLKAKGNPNADKIYFWVQHPTLVNVFKSRVILTLTKHLDYTHAQAKQWINEQL